MSEGSAVVVVSSAVLACGDVESGAGAYAAGVDSYSEGFVSGVDYCGA